MSVLDAFGNAMTTTNRDASRYSKFVRINFGGNGRVTTGDMDVSLLDPNRLTLKPANERNFHIFYQLLASNRTTLLKKLLLDQASG